MTSLSSFYHVSHPTGGVSGSKSLGNIQLTGSFNQDTSGKETYGVGISSRITESGATIGADFGHSGHENTFRVHLTYEHKFK